MNTQKYTVNQVAISTLLSYVQAGEIAIPETQRPFVWDSSRVRDWLLPMFMNGQVVFGGEEEVDNKN